MAALIINSERHEWQAGEYDSVLDIMLAAQERELWNPGASIAKVVVDGEGVEPLDETTLRAIPGANAEIEITLVEEKERPLGETVTEAGAYLEKLEEGLGQLAEKIRMEAEPEHYKRLREGLEGLSAILDLIGLLRDRLEVDASLNEACQEYMRDLNDKLMELNDAQESQDPTLIADILEYELVEAIQELRPLLSRFESFVK